MNRNDHISIYDLDLFRDLLVKIHPDQLTAMDATRLLQVLHHWSIHNLKGSRDG